MPKLKNIKFVQFGCTTTKDFEVLKNLGVVEEVIMIILNVDDDKMYALSTDSCEELTGAARYLVENGMFPSITGVIRPKFKMVRIDVPTILANVANIQALQKTGDKKKVPDRVVLASEPKKETKKTTKTKTTSTTNKAPEKKETTTKKTTKSATTTKKAADKPTAKKTTTKKTEEKPAAKKTTAAKKTATKKTTAKKTAK